MNTDGGSRSLRSLNGLITATLVCLVLSVAAYMMNGWPVIVSRGIQSSTKPSICAPCASTLAALR